MEEGELFSVLQTKMDKRSSILVPQVLAKKKSEDWLDPSKAVVPTQEDLYAEFAMPPREVKLEMYKGYGNVGFSVCKGEERWRKEGGIRKGQWVDPVVYTPNNLPRCYGDDWDR